MGFVTAERYVITAGHCLPRPPDFRNPGEDVVHVQVRPFDKPGPTATSVVTALECCADVAVLGRHAFACGDPAGVKLDSLLAATRSAPILRGESRRDQTRVWLYTHEGQWLRGEVGGWTPGQVLLEALFDDRSSRVRGGTSGAPLFDAEGCVIGIVSRSPEGRGSVQVVRMAGALPAWFLEEARHRDAITARGMFDAVKQDGCIWFKHLPEELVGALAALPPEEVVSLDINGIPTRWARVKRGTVGRDTACIRPADRHAEDVWRELPMGTEVTIAIVAIKAGNWLCPSEVPRNGPFGALPSQDG